jgi:ATP-dependent Clp protease ATP-binding subunit ClpA
MFEKFSDDARRVVVTSFSEASTQGHTEIDSVHLLLGLTQPGDGSVSDLLAQAGVTGEVARTRFVELVGSNPTPTSGHLPFTDSAKTVLSRAQEDAQSRGDLNIRSENLLRAILTEDDGVAAQVLSEVAGTNLAALREEVGRAGGDSTSP